MTRTGWLILTIIFALSASVVLYLYLQTPKETAKPKVEPKVQPSVEPSKPSPTPTIDEKDIRKETPRPEVPIPSSVKQIGDGYWRVYLTSTDWFDTGIPAIANQYTWIQGQPANARWLSKIGDKVFLGQAEWQHIATEEDLGGHPGMVVDYDFHDTFKLKLDDESNIKEVTLIIHFSDDGCPIHYDDKHDQVHVKWKAWRATMLDKIARK